MKSYILFLPVLFSLFFFSSSNSLAQLLLLDDFESKNEYWYWRADGNQSQPTVENGLLHLRLMNAVDSFYCNTEIYDPTEPYGPGTQVRTRLKTSNIHNGSRGWGFWDGDLTPNDIQFEFDVAWVMQQGSQIQGSDFNWFYFGVAGDSLSNRQTFNLQNIVDETEWHTYKIIWDFNKVSFSVDGILLYEIYEFLPDQKMRMDIWIDNRVINQSKPLELWNNNAIFSEMFVDFVEISGLEGPGIKREITDQIILWDSPNTFPDGENEYLWKKYNFNTTRNGEALIFVTGSAESYGTVSEKDKLKIVVNNIDYGWTGQYSFDGDNLKGKGKSIVLPIELDQGENNLEIYSCVTPFLRDVIVAYSDDGKVLFNRNYNETAEGEDGLWKTIEFDSHNSNKIAILISGTGNKNDGLRFELNNKNFGWKSEYAIDGDELKSIPNTIILSEELVNGKNFLKIYKKGSPQLYSIAAYGNSTITNIEVELEPKILPEITINPNPFNISTKINYSTRGFSKNKVTILNVLGEEIATLVNKFQPGGNHSIVWNAARQSSGIYFCIFQADDYFLVERILLLK